MEGKEGGQTGRWMDEQINKQTDGQKDRDRQTHKQKTEPNKQTDRQRQ